MQSLDESFGVNSERTAPKHVKKALSAWIIFSTERRHVLAQDSVKRNFQEIARLIADEYKALPQEEKEKYENLANQDKERYKREMEEFKEYEATYGSEQTEVNGEKGSSSSLILPLSKIRRTIKMDPDVKSISKEALSTITKATELFVGYMAIRSRQYPQQRGAKTIKGTDVGLTIHQNSMLEFLREDFPFSEELAKAAAAASKASSSSHRATASSATANAGRQGSITSFFAASAGGSGSGTGSEAALEPQSIESMDEGEGEGEGEDVGVDEEAEVDLEQQIVDDLEADLAVDMDEGVVEEGEGEGEGEEEEEADGRRTESRTESLLQFEEDVEADVESEEIAEM